MPKLTNPDAAGIDVASGEHVVAVSPDKDPHPVRTFSSFTQDLHKLARWLKSCGVKTVVMESTGVYWIHLFTVLESYNLQVLLVNAHFVKKVPGRKSDVSDAQWLQELHTYGLLKGCFQPDNLTRITREYTRTRKRLVKNISTETNRAQKALQQMNIKLNNVLRSITSKSGTAIINKILTQADQPNTINAEELADLADPRVKASRETLVKSLEGNWREEQLFCLKLAWESIRFYKDQIQMCDCQLEEQLRKYDGAPTEPQPHKTNRREGNRPSFKVEKYIQGILGVDVSQIEGFKALSALKVFSETGPDLQNKFPTEKQFVSWLNLVPNNKITGGKMISSRMQRKKNNAGQAFREAANGVNNSKGPIGQYYRSLRQRSGANKAIIATARRIAVIYYKMVTDQVEYNPNLLVKRQQESIAAKIEHYERKIIRLREKASGNQGLAVC